MLRSLECDQRIVQPLRLPVGLRFAPTSRVSGNSVKELVMSNILRPLVRVTAARSRRADQRQANRMVVRLIRSILAIGQDGRAELAPRVGQIDPLMGWHFEFFRLRSRPFNCPD